MTGDPFYETVTEQGVRRARLRSGVEVCDFCLTPDPAWEYPARRMEIVGHPVIDISDDEWGACDRCRQLIDAQNFPALVRHAVRTQRKLVPDGTVRDEKVVRYPPLRQHEQLLMRNVLRFMDARSGPARRCR